MIVNIKDRNIELKNTFRSLIIYEEITGVSFKGNGMKEILIYFYSVIVGSDKDANIDFDEFIDWLDANEDVFNEFVNWMVEVSKKNNYISKNDNENQSDEESGLKKNN